MPILALVFLVSIWLIHNSFHQSVFKLLATFYNIIVSVTVLNQKIPYVDIPLAMSTTGFHLWAWEVRFAPPRGVIACKSQNQSTQQAFSPTSEALFHSLCCLTAQPDYSVEETSAAWPALGLQSPPELVPLNCTGASLRLWPPTKRFIFTIIMLPFLKAHLVRFKQMTVCHDKTIKCFI